MAKRFKPTPLTDEHARSAPRGAGAHRTRRRAASSSDGWQRWLVLRGRAGLRRLSLRPRPVMLQAPDRDVRRRVPRLAAPRPRRRRRAHAARSGSGRHARRARRRSRRGATPAPTPRAAQDVLPPRSGLLPEPGRAAPAARGPAPLAPDRRGHRREPRVGLAPLRRLADGSATPSSTGPWKRATAARATTPPARSRSTPTRRSTRRSRRLPRARARADPRRPPRRGPRPRLRRPASSSPRASRSSQPATSASTPARQRSSTSRAWAETAQPDTFERIAGLVDRLARRLEETLADDEPDDDPDDPDGSASAAAPPRIGPGRPRRGAGGGGMREQRRYRAEMPAGAWLRGRAPRERRRKRDAHEDLAARPGSLPRRPPGARPPRCLRGGSCSRTVRAATERWPTGRAGRLRLGAGCARVSRAPDGTSWSVTTRIDYI